VPIVAADFVYAWRRTVDAAHGFRTTPGPRPGLNAIAISEGR